MATQEQIKAAVENLKEVVVAVTGLKTQRGFVPICKMLIQIVPDIIQHVEGVSLELGLKGADKKQLAIDLIMHFVSPFIPMWVPNSTVEFAAGLLIDCVVNVFNKIKGKVWK
jgi:hypothetical protein